jgi:uncharacterized membrane protein
LVPGVTLMGGWSELGTVFALFAASHAIPARPAMKAQIVAAIGRPAYLALFNGLSLVLLAWLIVAAGRAPYIGLWEQQIWQRWLANLAMPLAVAFAVFGTGAINPLALGGRRVGFDPARPGIAGLVRHPLLWALLVWSCVHAVVKGDLAHVLLFGGFAVMAIAGMLAIDARRRDQFGAANWKRLAESTSLLPGAAWLAGRWHPKSRPSPWRMALAMALWISVLWLHPIVIGVSPLP